MQREHSTSDTLSSSQQGWVISSAVVSSLLSSVKREGKRRKEISILKIDLCFLILS